MLLDPVLFIHEHEAIAVSYSISYLAINPCLLVKAVNSVRQMHAVSGSSTVPDRTAATLPDAVRCSEILPRPHLVVVVRKVPTHLGLPRCLADPLPPVLETLLELGV